MLLEDDPQLGTLLNTHGNFEDALQLLQNEFARSKSPNHIAHQLQAFQRAVSETFSLMNTSLARRQFEFCNDIKYSISFYLTRFDAIFTLNQDLLLERHYLTPNTILAASGGKVSGGEIPGMHPQPSQNCYIEDEPLYTRWHPKSPFSHSPSLQPYFKLHGSSNWFSTMGEQLMIVGGDKSRAISSHPILLWYFEKFEEFLSLPGSRLTVIGYSFGDKHVNDAIYNAWKKSKMPMMIVGPSGRSILNQAVTRHPRDQPGSSSPLAEINCFDSVRVLASTFGGNDPAEHGNLIRFLKLP
jgi:hypothetical protein